MTAYHVLISDELAAQIPDLNMPEGFRFVRPSGPGDDGCTRWWLCEDDGAPADLEQHRVEVVFSKKDGRNVITGRHVVNVHSARVNR